MATAVSVSGSGSSISIQLSTNSTNNSTAAPTASVFMVVDTSGSMKGAKIKEVCKAIKEMIDMAPGYVRFDVNVFDTDCAKLVSKKKRYLDVDRLTSAIMGRGGGRTALYDAWGQTMKDIPYAVSKMDYFHLLVFTDGEDNCSQKFTQEEIIEMLNEKMGRNSKMRFSFIQAGKRAKKMEGLESKFTAMNRCTILDVQDSVEGIKQGFEKVRKEIKTQLLELNLNISSDGVIGTQLKVLSLNGRTGNRAVNGTGVRPAPRVTNPPRPPSSWTSGLRQSPIPRQTSAPRQTSVPRQFSAPVPRPPSFWYE